MKFVKYFLIFALVALVLIQFYRPEKNESGYETVAHFEQEAQVSPALAAVFKTNCYDCHSDQTIYPWYSEVAPASFWLDDHVRDGKKHFNVSAWESYSAKKKDHKLDELIEFVEDGEMPLDSYTWLHGDLSDDDTKAILDWAQLQRLKYQKEMTEMSK
ncbi:heme-binding protein [Patiriisocius marinistellae]|uniref:Heme-binding protein n=1 Tax=Patiriisocius marinistellae TaxID=2494560 RepID=A0A5J4FXF2_9FLAO|nr:heme-binding domain-containing protein [Patiriisocius marinistellae]GEQ86733.1 heme-binding protein [Patiriisocius marinistellae]